MLYPKIQGREEEILQTIRTWKALGGKLYVLGEIWHCAAIWLKLKSGCGCHPASWYFCFKDLLAVKEILLAIKRPVFLASFLDAWFPFHHLLFAKSACDRGGVCEGMFLRNTSEECGQHTSPQLISNPLLQLQYLVLLPVWFLPLNYLLSSSGKQKPYQKLGESWIEKSVTLVHKSDRSWRSWSHTHQLSFTHVTLPSMPLELLSNIRVHTSAPVKKQ